LISRPLLQGGPLNFGEVTGRARLEHQRAVAELILVAQYLGALRYAASTAASSLSGRRKVSKRDRPGLMIYPGWWFESLEHEFHCSIYWE
jgi:hypothetical protein